MQTLMMLASRYRQWRKNAGKAGVYVLDVVGLRPKRLLVRDLLRDFLRPLDSAACSLSTSSLYFGLWILDRMTG